MKDHSRPRIWDENIRRLHIYESMNGYDNLNEAINALLNETDVPEIEDTQ